MKKKICFCCWLKRINWEGHSKNYRKLNKHWYYWCPHTDSNREPTDYKSVALPIEL